jgi:hypothetical protein
MHTSLLILPVIIDNPNLILAFSRITSLRLIDDDGYFILRYGTATVRGLPPWKKFLQSFPSLTKIEIRILYLEYCEEIIDTFLTGFEQLHLIIVEFVSNRLPCSPISRDYVIEKRRHSFGLNRNDEYKVNVILGDDNLRISIP